jgi:hypothetical protein
MRTRWWWAAALVVGVECAGCGQRASSAGAPTSTATSSAIAIREEPPDTTETTATREEPPDTMGTTVAPSRGDPSACSGSVTIPALTEAERKELIDKVLARNLGASAGHRGREPTISSRGYFIWLSGPIQPSPGDGEGPKDVSAAKERALTLVRKNADLLGFTAQEWKAAKVEIKEVSMPGTHMAWFTLSGAIPRGGYEEFPSVAKRVHIHVSVYKGGAMSLTSTGTVLPPFKLCKTARLAAGDPAVTREVLGRELRYSGLGGEPHSVGTVETRDIGAIEKTIHAGSSDKASAVTLTLAYAIVVNKAPGPWTAFVDANTGRLIEMRQDFRT